MLANRHRDWTTSSVLTQLSLRHSRGFSIALTSDDCQPFFQESQKATFTTKHLQSVFRAVGVGLPAWYLTRDQLACILTGISRTDINRLVYNFIHLTNQLAVRRFRHKLWRNSFTRTYLENSELIQQESAALHHHHSDEAIRWSNIDFQQTGVLPDGLETESLVDDSILSLLPQL